MTEILMPQATAVWLIDNTSLTFEQVADLCQLHPLKVKGIADGDVAADVRGADPIANGQLTREEIARAEADPAYRLKPITPKHQDVASKTKKKGARYTPLSRRQERPNAIAWLVKNHPELTDRQISKLIGTTPTTIQTVRDRSHWNASNIQPTDPVALGLCSQLELDEVVRKAASKLPPEPEKPEETDTLSAAAADDPHEPSRRSIDAAEVFANLGGSSHSSGEDDEQDGN